MCVSLYTVNELFRPVENTHRWHNCIQGKQWTKFLLLVQLQVISYFKSRSFFSHLKSLSERASRLSRAFIILKRSLQWKRFCYCFLFFASLQKLHLKGFKLLQSYSARAVHNHFKTLMCLTPTTRRALNDSFPRRALAAHKATRSFYNVSSCNKNEPPLFYYSLRPWAGEHHVYRVQ